jgi:Fe-S oxidoreductase/FAD/FMN-containing dehydrogenase
MNEKDLEKDLQSIIGDRVTVSEFERWFYSRDLIHIPGIVTHLFKTMPAAIVRPATTAQVSMVASYCHEHKIPVVPRGAGSSGLFGAIPKRGGVVLDLTDLTKVIEINTEKREITTEAGVIWWQLEKSLQEKGLSLKTYPSSARSSTIGGWVMTSGLGIGSLKYGPLFNDILQAELVHPDGSINKYTAGERLGRFFKTEGMLGIVTSLTLRVRQRPDAVSHHLVYFAEINNLFKALKALANVQPCPYNMEFMDNNYLNLLKDAGYAVTEFTRGSGTLLVTYDGQKEEVDRGQRHLEEINSKYQGTEREGANIEWEHRFNMLRVRRAVPSIIPSSVFVPIENMGAFYTSLEKLNKRSIGIIGYAVSNTECSLMPMIATNEEKATEYIFALHTPRELSNLALSLGGRPGGGIGIWNAPYKNKILDRERSREIRRLKIELDPKNIMNPGMWTEPPLLFKPKTYQFVMGVASSLDHLLPAGVERNHKELKSFDKELRACVQCGYCMNVCPTRQDWLSSTPRGRILMTRQLFLANPNKYTDITAEYLSRLFQCTLCGRCRIDCSVDIKSRPMFLGIRDYLLKKGIELESLKGLARVINETHNIAGRPNEQRAGWLSRVKLPYDLGTKKTAEFVYFVGCVSSFFPIAQPAARAFVQILNAAGIDFTVVGGEEWCCGFPLMSAGFSTAAEKCVRHNIERIRQMGAKTLLVTCPGCYRVWKEEYQDVVEEKHPFNVLHSTEFIARLIEDGKLTMKGLELDITYHDPCDLGRNAGIFDEPRYIINRIPGLSLVELEENRQYCTCCGSGGDLLASNQEMSLAIARRKVDEILRTGVQNVATACPSCVRAIHMAKTTAKTKLDVFDITELVLKAIEN